MNTAAWTEGQPNVRRDGLEIFYFSNRPSGIAGTGGNDIYVATRATTAGDWENAHGLGAEVNSPSAETRPSLSWDGTTLYFGSNRPPGGGLDSDHYVTKRAPVAP